MSRLLPIFAVVAACNTTTVNTPVRSFDRPTDVALACVQFDERNQVWTPRTLSDCTPDRKDALKYPYVDPIVGGEYIYPQLRGFVTQSSRGESAEVDAEIGFLLDYNRGVPGYNFLPTGGNTEHVRAADDGCHAFTTNPGTCDLAAVDLTLVYNAPFLPFVDGGAPGFPDGMLPAGYGDTVVQHLAPSVNGVKLGARPTWIEMAPETVPADHAIVIPPGDMGAPPDLAPPKTGASDGGVGDGGVGDGGTSDMAKQPPPPPVPVGQCRGGSYRAWVALPGCELIVEVDLNHPETGNAEVVQALRVTQSGVSLVTDLKTLSCPAECGNEVAAPLDFGVSPDASASVPDGGVRLPDNQSLPAAFAIDFENNTGRLIVADQSSPRLAILPIDKQGAVGTPRTLSVTPNALGVSVVRVSPRTPSGKFVYAVARDGTVRVIDLDREVECETHPDPRYFQQIAPFDPHTNAAVNGCLPLGDPSTPPRSPLFTTPGIELANGALPRDVAFVHVDATNPTDPTIQPQSAGPLTMTGDFAWIIGTDGRASAVNIFDGCPAPNVSQGTTGEYTPECAQANAAPSRALALALPAAPQPIVFERLSHRQRAGGARFATPLSCSDPTGAPRLNDESNPYSITVGNIGGGASQISIDAGSTVQQYPSLVPVPVPPITNLPPDVAQLCNDTQRSVGFQEIDRLRSETWTVGWEGFIPGTLRSSGNLGAGGVFLDAGAAWCSRGVLAGDKVYLDGCNQDTDCDYAQECFKDPGAPLEVTTGLCLERDDTQRAPQETGCVPLLRGVRRYRIVSARQAGPTMGPPVDTLKLAEIYEPEYAPETKLCDPSTPNDCAAITVPGLVGGVATAVPTSCLLDVDGAYRCIRACTPLTTANSQDPTAVTNAACGDGYQCAPAHSVPGGGSRCMRVPLDDILVTARSQGGYDCLRETQRYEIHGGDGFVITGSLTGLLVLDEPGPTGECQVPPPTTPYTRLRQSRIPLDGLVNCFDPNDGVKHTIDEIVAPLAPAGAPGSNVCLFADTSAGKQIHFENAFFAFGLQLPTGFEVPPERLALTFIVIGGSFPLAAQLGVDVAAQDPIAAVVSPDRATVYVVDRGKQSTASGLRGQLIKLSTVGVGTDRGFIVR